MLDYIFSSDTRLVIKEPSLKKNKAERNFEIIKTFKRKLGSIEFRKDLKGIRNFKIPRSLTNTL